MNNLKLVCTIKTGNVCALDNGSFMLKFKDGEYVDPTALPKLDLHN